MGACFRYLALVVALAAAGPVEALAQSRSASRASAAKSAPAPSPAPLVSSATSYRELAGGGLQIVTDPAVVLERREIKLSLHEVSASYFLRNTDRRQRRLLVTFTLPEIDTGAIGDQEVALVSKDPRNFVDAVFRAGDQVLTPEFEQRALAHGLDVTQYLTDARLSLFPLDPNVVERASKLSPDARSKLAERGIVRIDDGRAEPNWTLRTTAHWLQVFPEGASVVLTVTYKPLIGATRYSAELGERLRKSYCLTDEAEDLLRRKRDAVGIGSRIEWITYGMSSDGSWGPPTGPVRVMIEKPDLTTAVATCRGPFRAMGPTTVEWNEQNPALDEDWGVLLIR